MLTKLRILCKNYWLCMCTPMSFTAPPLPLPLPPSTPPPGDATGLIEWALFSPGLASCHGSRPRLLIPCCWSSEGEQNPSNWPSLLLPLVSRLGIFPICGTTVILGAVAVAMLGTRCNAVTLMVLNLAATPIELSLIVPFLRLGETMTGSGHFPLTAATLKNVLTGHASKDVLLSIVHAMLGWLIAAPFVLAVLYAISFPCFKVLVSRFGGIPSSPRTPIKAV